MTRRPRGRLREINLRKRPVRARTAAQDAYIRALRRHALVFGTGPAGTGKTWLAVAHAVQLFERKEVDRIILSRPAVEAGERLGFLPGDMREKVDPYLRPIYDALYDLMDARIVERTLETGEIEIAPLAFMRGRTLSNAVIILDEAQNTTAMQMKMFLTRLGENSRMIVTGDPSQVDLPPGQTSASRKQRGSCETSRELVTSSTPPRTSFGTSSWRALSTPTTRRRSRPRGRARPRNEPPRLHYPPRERGSEMTFVARKRRAPPPVRRRRTPLRVDIVVASPLWTAQRSLKALLRRAIGEAASMASTIQGQRGELAIVLTDDTAIRALNRDWRSKDATTNVLLLSRQGPAPCSWNNPPAR